ncbi:MAG: 3-phosphoshikimate 1-carboxyvinyltransferase [Chloroherpetonaceae bacterium]|nr:3-phosphoshikimate 1-carboxyvinyltransferase [Chloroherpetonaceae bacterium]MDW8437773.1 3-phosphoshikimate 1-carboxyvinyltransferase [Chloroherpetonaceae bacterium]
MKKPEFRGVVASLPPDKSISHRAALIGAISTGETRIENFSSGADNQSTLSALSRLGVKIQQEVSQARRTVVIRSNGLFDLKPSQTPIPCDNSGSTMRMLAGILAAQPFRSTLVGDSSLMKRPMRRVALPLSQMGASVSLSENGTAPIEIRGRKPLSPIAFETPVASAQVKSCVIFAALHADGESEISEPIQTRNHTETMLGLLDPRSPETPPKIKVRGLRPLEARDFFVPADPSAACFLVALALLSKSPELVLKNVCLNPTRTGFLSILSEAGATIRTENERTIGGERIGDVVCANASLETPLRISDKALVANAIDELPMLAVLSALATGEFELRNAEELRAKESDRIAALVLNLRAMGYKCEEFSDGFAVGGREKIFNGSIRVKTFSDHRIAMSFGIASLFFDSELVLDDRACVVVSFPNFFELIDLLQ